MDELTQRRFIHNERMFREVNEKRRGATDAPVLTFVCECSDRACSDQIQLTLAEYEAVRCDPRQFLLIPGHELAEIERVVERHPQYEIVEKNAA
jgi:hypothetical protein